MRLTFVRILERSLVDLILFLRECYSLVYLSQCAQGA